MNAEEVKQRFQQAAALFQAQQYENALQVLEQLDNAVPNNSDIMYFKARVLGVLSRIQEAAALCDRLTALGDPRGGQLKAALSVAPSGPPPFPSPQDQPAAGPPPLLPGQDMTEPSYLPPRFAAGRGSNKRMNIIGFSLMGALLLAALVVVIVRGRGGEEEETLPPQAPAGEQLAAAQTEASTEAATPETAPGETTAAPAAAEQPAPPAAGAESTQALMARLEGMAPAEQAKAMAEMDTAQLAELMKIQTATVLEMMEKQAATPQAIQVAAQLRQQFEQTDFIAAAKMTKELLAQATPEMLAQMGASSFTGSEPSSDLMTNDIMKGLNLDKGVPPETPENAAPGETNTATEAAAPAEQPEEPPQEAEEAPEEVPAAAPKEPAGEAKPQPEEEEPVKPVFGKEVARIIEFPKDESLGSLFLRRSGVLEREPWEKVGEAKGKIGIPPNQDVKLQMQTYHVGPLLKLGPDDIQVLSLWSVKVGDENLEPVKHLTGLKELDIRQTRITQDGWRKLQEALPKCRILY